MRGLLDALERARRLSGRRARRVAAREAKRFLAGPRRRGRETTRGHALLQLGVLRTSPLPRRRRALVDRPRESGRLSPASSTSPRGVGRTPGAGRRDRVRPPQRALPAQARPRRSTRGAPTAAAREWLDRSWAITHPFGTGGVYPNFPEDGLDPWAREYLGPNRERLLSVKRRYDPDGVFG